MNDCNVVPDGADHHRGEYWYRCITCGRTDWCARYDRFERKEPLKDCEGEYTVKVNRGISVKETTKRYVRILTDGTARISTLEELINVPASVKIYELGAEVRVKTRVEVVPVETESHTGKQEL